MRAMLLPAVLLPAMLLPAVPVAAEPLRAGEVRATLAIEAGIDPRTPLRPISFAPDLYFGASDALSVGLIHSDLSLDRIAAGASFCARELPEHCERIYRGSGLYVAWRFVHVRALVRDLDPIKPAITAGISHAWTRGAWDVTTDPYLRIGLAHREEGNRDALVVPVWLGRRTGRWRFALHTGVDGELATWRDGYHVPVALRAEVAPATGLIIGLEAGLPSLLGPQNSSRNPAAILWVTFTPRRRSAAPARGSAGTVAPGGPASRD